MTGNNFSTGSITRKDAFTTAMFAVQDNSTLTLGNGSKPLIIDGSVLALEGGGGDNSPAIDGGELSPVNEALIKTGGTGKVIMNGGVTLQYNEHGGVYMEGGTFTMNGGEISGNTAANSGGGVFFKDHAFGGSGQVSGNTTNAGTDNIYYDNN